MSKFIDAIHAELTGKRAIAYPPLSCFEPLEVTKNVTELDMGYLQEYRIEVAYRVMVTCKPTDVDPVMNNVISQLKRAVYGDIVDSFIALERAIYGHKDDEAMARLRDMRQELLS